MVASVLLFFCKGGSLVLFYAGLGVIAFSFGSLMGIYPGFTAQRFGRKNNSANYGMTMIGFSLAGILGPMGMNAIHNMTGRYQPAFLTAAVLSAVGQVFLALLRRSAKKRRA
jgi:MFS family permease